MTAHVNLNLFPENFTLTLFRIGVFGAAHGWWQGDLSLPKMCHKYPGITKILTVICYLGRLKKHINYVKHRYEFF